MKPTTSYRAERRYYAQQYWYYRLLCHSMKTIGGKLAWDGIAQIQRAHWRDLWEKRRAM